MLRTRSGFTWRRDMTTLLDVIGRDVVGRTAVEGGRLGGAEPRAGSIPASTSPALPLCWVKSSAAIPFLSFSTSLTSGVTRVWIQPMAEAGVHRKFAAVTRFVGEASGRRGRHLVKVGWCLAASVHYCVAWLYSAVPELCFISHCAARKNKLGDFSAPSSYPPSTTAAAKYTSSLPRPLSTPGFDFRDSKSDD